MEIKSLHTQYHTFGFSYPYNPDIVEYCRNLKTALGGDAINFDTTHKAWVFRDPVIAAMIMQRYPDCTVDKDTLGLLEAATAAMSKEVAKTQKLAEIKTATDSDIVIPGMKGSLYKYQKLGIEFIIASGGRCILGDDPGLGKTAMAIGAILSLGSERSLVVCPASVKYMWKSEIEKWSDLKSIVIGPDTIIEAIPKDTNVLIVNYDLLKRHISALLRNKFDTLVLDEAHYIKTQNTIRSRAIRILAKDIKHVVMLTATLVLNRSIELFNPLNIIDPKRWNSYYSFANRYCAMHRTRFGIDVSGSSNTEELSKKLEKYFIRRRKEEVLPALPRKIRVTVPVDLEGDNAKLYQKAYRNFAHFLRDNKDKTDVEIKRALQAEKLVRLNALREIATGGKINSAIEIIENVISSGAKINVFASFVAPLKALKEYFGDKAVIITGETDLEERFEIVKKFQEDPSVQVFLGGYKSAGVGVTLTRASSVLFLDQPWGPQDLKQSEDRAHRIGSEHESITIYTLLARNSVDDMMVKMIDHKRKIIEGLIGEGDDQSAFEMAMEDFEKEALNVV